MTQGEWLLLIGFVLIVVLSWIGHSLDTTRKRLGALRRDLAKDAKRLRRRFRRVEQRIDRIVWNVRRIEERTWYLLEPNITRPEDLHVGDLVIHRQHGLGRYVGTSRQMSDGEELDYLDLEYAEGYKLHLPVVRLDMICRYQGDPRTAVLDTLGG
jgi:CarD-like protein